MAAVQRRQTAARGLSGEAKSLATLLGDQEAEHVAALTKAITAAGGTPVKKPTFVFPVTDQASFLKLAYTLAYSHIELGREPRVQRWHRAPDLRMQMMRATTG